MAKQNYVWWNIGRVILVVRNKYTDFYDFISMSDLLIYASHYLTGLRGKYHRTQRIDMIWLFGRPYDCLDGLFVVIHNGFTCDDNLGRLHFAKFKQIKTYRNHSSNIFTSKKMILSVKV
jgi:hypothetical protein